MQALTKLKAMFGDVVAQDRELKEKINKNKEQIQTLTNAPVTKEDYASWIDRCIDLMAEEYVERLGVQTKMDNSRDISFFDKAKVFPVLGPNNPAGFLHPTMEALFWMLRDQIKDGFKKALDRIDWQTSCEIPLTERKRQIAFLEKEIATLEQQRTELRAVLALAGRV